MVRLLNSGMRANGPRRYQPRSKPENTIVPAGTLEERLAWVAEAEDQDDRSARANEIWDHEKASDPDFDEAKLSGQLRKAVYDRVAHTETLETPGASGENLETPTVSGVPSDGPIDSEIVDGVIQPLEGVDLDEQIETPEPDPEPTPKELPPEGDDTIKSLLKWIEEGDVSARGRTVIDLENAKKEKDRRKTLISSVEDLIIKDDNDLI